MSNMTMENGGGVAAPPRDAVLLNTVGKSITRVDGRPKVMGQTIYSTDFYLENMLHAKVLYSDRPRARIVSIDTGRARELPGVAAVLTGDDVPDIRYGQFLADKIILAKGEVKYAGEHVAAVAAETEAIAEKAVRLIEVTYEDLPAILSTEEALAAGAPMVHPDVADYGAAHPYIRYGNVCLEAEVGHGDVPTALMEADVVVTTKCRTAAIDQAPIEPHATVAGFDHRHRLTVWTATQQLSVCHEEVATALGVPMNEVRVVPLGLGGGFGGKLASNL